MNESGATAFEVREMAHQIENDRNMFLGRVLIAENDDSDPLAPMERAILVEALTLLAEKKEAQRTART